MHRTPLTVEELEERVKSGLTMFVRLDTEGQSVPCFLKPWARSKEHEITVKSTSNFKGGYSAYYHHGENKSKRVHVKRAAIYGEPCSIGQEELADLESQIENTVQQTKDHMRELAKQQAQIDKKIAEEKEMSKFSSYGDVGMYA